MFITLTINTTRQNKIHLHRRRFNAATGWRKTIHARKRNLLQRFFAWRRHIKAHHYKLDGQIAMF